MNTIEITILNWEKFNPRKDLKATSWLRLQNSLFEDPQFFEFSHAEICFWIYALSMASKKQTGHVIINLKHAERIGRFSEAVVLKSIEKLKEIKCIEARNVDVTCTLRACDVDVTLRTNERTNDIVSPDGDTPLFDLEEIYREYPKRKNSNKGGGMSRLRKLIKKQIDFDLALIAARNYKRFTITEKTKPEFIMMFSTFFGRDDRWKDFTEQQQNQKPRIVVDIAREY